MTLRAAGRIHQTPFPHLHRTLGQALEEEPAIDLGAQEKPAAAGQAG